jgi:hypothetical protein
MPQFDKTINEKISFINLFLNKKSTTLISKNFNFHQ